MRIGIDARELVGRATGAGRYLGGLLQQWSVDPTTRRHEFVLYAPQPLTISLDSRRFATRVVPGRAGTWWEQMRLPGAIRRDHLDLFFSPAYSAPLRIATPTVVAIHDVSFVAHPEWFRTREGVRRRWLTRESAARARAIVTISEFSAREISDRLGVADSRLHVIPPGVTAPTDRRASSVREERILFVGSIFNRRHVPDLIRSFRLLAERQPAAMLDIVGDNRTYPHEDLERVIAAEGLERGVRWHRYATDAQLADMYRRAGVFAFLSTYEGLGLTPLEALAARVPVVLTDTPVARESCGEAALYVPGGDLNLTARALEQALLDAETRQRLLAAAPEALAKYQWPRAARETLELLERSA